MIGEMPMTLTEILSTARKILDDSVAPYLWADEELVACVNDRLYAMCAETHCITD
jgi:hypothetical protein